ncbi:MAG: hypothetical protein MUQ65_16000 [Armatimonadetes bacterium]|nr:hypothetical protein [Armatimonadota bacterium]
MFQMAEDGSIWVLDSVNSRVIQFTNGKQVQSIDVSGFSRRPDYFGITTAAVFVFKQGQRDDMPSTVLLRYDRERASSTTIDLDLPDGRRFSPLHVSPLGRDNARLLLSGRTWPDSKMVTLVLDNQGEVSRVLHDTDLFSLLPAPDGTVWEVHRSDAEESDTALPLTLRQYDEGTKAWRSMGTAILPKRAELAAQRPKAKLRALGLDSHGTAIVKLSEGSPLQPRFMRISSTSGEVQAFTLEDLGFDSAPLTRFFASEYYQVLPGGSILAQYANSERYRILRISF